MLALALLLAVAPAPDPGLPPDLAAELEYHVPQREACESALAAVSARVDWIDAQLDFHPEWEFCAPELVGRLRSHRAACLSRQWTWEIALSCRRCAEGEAPPDDGDGSESAPVALPLLLRALRWRVGEASWSLGWAAIPFPLPD